MKEEFMELLDWLEKQLTEASKLPDDEVGFDAGQRAQREKKVNTEYRRRLIELKTKHGVA